MNEMIRNLKEVYDYNDCKYILQGGCVSGTAHSHIYYSQTNSFYDEFTDEVIEYVKDNMGNNYPACLFVENDYDLILYKNAIVWCAIECFADDVVNTHQMLKRSNWNSKEWSSLANCLYKELES
jgi:hypothetical protein